MHQTQEILDRYNVGIEITEVNMGKVDRPAAVIESFRSTCNAPIPTPTDAQRG